MRTLVKSDHPRHVSVRLRMGKSRQRIERGIPRGSDKEVPRCLYYQVTVPLIRITDCALRHQRAPLKARFLGEHLSHGPLSNSGVLLSSCWVVAARRYYSLNRQQIKTRFFVHLPQRVPYRLHTLSEHLISCQCKNTSLTTTAQATHRRDGPGELRDLTFRVHCAN